VISDVTATIVASGAMLFVIMAWITIHPHHHHHHVPEGLGVFPVP